MNYFEKIAKQHLFFTIEKLRKEPVFFALEELRLNQEKDKETIEKLQNQKLRVLLSHSYLYSPYYSRLFKANGIKPDDIRTVDDLKIFPLLNKSDIRNNLKNIIASSGPTVYPVKTSGSTGSPLKFYKDRVSSAYSYAAMYRGHQWFGADVCDKEAYLWGIPIKRNDRMMAGLRDIVLNRFREKAFTLSFEVSMNFYEKMAKKKPVLLSGYSSLLYEFARFVRDHQLPVDPIRPKVIKYTAEMMYEFQRELIENIFDCPVIGEYGSAEIGVVAFQCQHRKYHLMTDCCAIEFEKAEKCEFYEIIASNLNGLGFPLIRYRTGDLVTNPKLGKCSCGLPFPIVENIIGRLSDIIVTPEGKRIHSNIFSYIIKHLLGKGYPIEQLLFSQEATSQLKILIPTDLSENKDFKKDVLDLIDAKISSGLNVCFEKLSVEDQIRSGKLRYFKSNM